MGSWNNFSAGLMDFHKGSFIHRWLIVSVSVLWNKDNKKHLFYHGNKVELLLELMKFIFIEEYKETFNNKPNLFCS